MSHPGSCFVRFSSLIVLVIVLARPSAARAASPEEIDQAIQKAKAYLYSQQKDGNWELVPQRQGMKLGEVRESQWGGLTSIVTYSLLATGERPQDDRIVKAVEFLRRADIAGIYALGLRAQIWHYLSSSPATRDAVKRDARLLLDAMRAEQDSRGMYYYFGGKGSGYDHSVSQFAVLGVWACAQTSAVEIPHKYWEEVDRAWRSHQYDSGAWSYIFRAQGKDGTETISMTAAGVATLFITQDFLASDAGLNCKGNVQDKSIERGLAWLASRVPQSDQWLHQDWPHYILYGLERIGVAGGYKYIGNCDWYRLGADHLIATQNSDGSWGGGHDGQAFYNTAFSMLFLSRGRAPVVLNKLQYDLEPAPGKKEPGNWNQRPRDAANITRWIGRQIERDLNWQIVNLNVPVEELHDAPILYIAGNQGLAFTPEQEAKLRTYVEQGGLILGNADCGNKLFVDSFRKLGTKLFPSYEFRELPADHVLYTGQQFERKKWKMQPGLLGLSNGVRELMLLIPQTDPAKAWQTMASTKQELYEVAANIVLYSVDRQNLRFKGHTHIVTQDTGINAKRTVKLARIQYDGNWDPEPGGWRRVATVLHNRYHVDLTTEAIKPGEGKLLPSTYRVAHLTGVDAPPKFSDAQRAEIKSFVDSGGTLIVDAAGGSPLYATAIETELAAIFGPAAAEQLKQPLAPGHPLFSVRAEKDPKVAYRRAALAIVGRSTSPRLRGIQIGNRIAVFYSHEDLSCGLVGHPVDGVRGYEPASATDCVTSMVLYAASQP